MAQLKSFLNAAPQCGIPMGVGLAILATLWGAYPAAAQEAGQKTYPSAAEACRALVAAVRANDQTAMLSVLGPDAKGILSSGDEVEDKDNRAEFVEKYEQMHRLVNEPDGTTTLYVGAENWPTPIPLVDKSGEWYFDTAAAKQEVLFRRIGRNELAVIQVCHELVDAEKEYFAAPHDGSATKDYAQKIYSTPGKHDGLYWEVGPGEPESPIGPFIGAAEAEGYGSHPGRRSEPFQGYYFRILKGQAANAPGGAHSYIANGKMTEGFAFLAYPAEYRSSGVMTFIVNQDGIVYQKDLGTHTPEIAKTLSLYDRGPTWQKAE